MKIQQISLTLLLCCFTLAVQARPVSYPGGWTFMQQHNVMMDSSHIHFSPTAKYSVGYKFERFRLQDAYSHAFQLNNLLHRFNHKGYQANIYLKSGLGIAHNSDRVAPALFSGIAMDWETRRLFASYSNRFYWAQDIQEYINNSFRVGVAPYVGDYGDLHTWFMLQFDHNAFQDEEFILTPLVRFFKSTFMLEIGYSFAQEDSMMANFYIRL